jgi:predicted Zn finger-like uncharacterized protein
MLVSCPNCGVKLDVPDEFDGKKVRCATCSSVFEARAGAAGPPPLPLPGESPPPEPKSFPLAPIDDDHHDEPDVDRHGDDDDDDDDYDGPAQRRRRMRRDLDPHRGNLILGLGIFSIVANIGGICCLIPGVIGIPLGIVSLLFGLADVRKMDAGDMDPDGRGATTAGYICAIIGLVFGLLAIARCILTIFGMAAFMAVAPR